MNSQAIADAKCREIYCEARDFFDKYAALPKYCGFNILQGPPLFRPPTLFIGYQPGGDHDEGDRERLAGRELKWASKCANATGSWRLSKKLQGMFTRPYLEKCVGVNAIFLRSPRIDDYKRDFDKSTRLQVEQFCLSQVYKIIETIDPSKIVAIGFSTFQLFGESRPGLINENGRTLTRVGQIAGRQAIAILHLSGARISNPDLNRIRDRVLVG